MGRKGKGPSAEGYYSRARGGGQVKRPESSELQTPALQGGSGGGREPHAGLYQRGFIPERGDLSMNKTLLVLALLPGAILADAPKKITHSFLATGGETFLLDGAGKLLWKYDRSSRDGW